MYKRSLFIICLFICLFSIAGVSAGDVDANVAATDGMDIQGELSIHTDEVLEEDFSSTDDASGDEVPLKANPKTFTDLNETINGNSNSEIHLYDDYCYNIDVDKDYMEKGYEKESFFDTLVQYGIVINRPLTIYGHGHTICGTDGIGHARGIFKVYSDSVTFHDIIFEKRSGMKIGGAIYAKNNIIVDNCTFSQNQAHKGGGVYVEGTATISNCEFINCTALNGNSGAVYANNGNISNCRFLGNGVKYIPYNEPFFAGAVYLGTGSVDNCYFEGNYVQKDTGGALYIGSLGKVSNCTFKGNYANKGGAIYADGDVIISDSKFIDNHADEEDRYSGKHNGYGGALALNGATVVNCSFTGNYAHNRGTISIANGSIINCTFANNRATEVGSGAIYIGTNANIENCNFTNNSAERRGGAIAIGSASNPSESWSTKIINCIFTNNMATLNGGAIFGGTAINCSFKGNTAKGGYSTYETKISPYANRIVAAAVSTVYNINKYLEITLKDNKGEAVKNYKLNVVINGKSYVYTTNSLGKVKISTKTWSPKVYQISISTSEKNTHYLTVETKNTRVLVNKAVPKLTASAKTYYLKDKTKKYVAVLKTNTNQFLKNAKVTVNVGGKTYSIKTNAKGQAIFSLNQLNKKGSFKAVIKFAGNGYYTAINKSVYIRVK